MLTGQACQRVRFAAQRAQGSLIRIAAVLPLFAASILAGPAEAQYGGSYGGPPRPPADVPNGAFPPQPPPVQYPGQYQPPAQQYPAPQQQYPGAQNPGARAPTGIQAQPLPPPPGTSLAPPPVRPASAPPPAAA